MKKVNIIILLFFFLFLNNDLLAQQDAQYTQYTYNMMSINPAYAGSSDVFSFVGLYRTQWVGLDGAPKTFTGSAHSPVGKRVGLGFNIINDEIFISQETYLDLAFSYNINVSEAGRIAFGIKAGGHLLDIDSARSNTGGFNAGDPNAAINISNKFSPQIGLGIYYNTDRFFIGLSTPNILETEHFNELASNNSEVTARERITAYLASGYVFDLSSNVKFKPTTLIKTVPGAPLQIDLSTNFLINEKVTFGAAYRFSASISGMVAFQLSEEIKIGLAYDSETTKLQQYNYGSYEFFLSYELRSNQKNRQPKRFF